MNTDSSYTDLQHPDRMTLAGLTVHEHRCLVDRLDKHDRELSAIRSLLISLAGHQPIVIEVRELRVSGYTFAGIARRTGLTRNMVASIIGQDGAA